MLVSVKQTADILKSMDNVLILTHQSPDGDTLGSGYALCYALRNLGKKANVVCADKIPEKYSYFTAHYTPKEFEVENVVAVDVADTKLLGNLSEVGEIHLCIDHHGSNRQFADYLCLDSNCASTTELLYEILCEMNVIITKDIANCIYTGLSTDTGCFKYTNTTAKTLRTAAEMLEKGADAGMINTLMFETKSLARVQVEKEVYNTMEIALNGECAIVAITADMLERTGAVEDELEGVSAMPRQIVGVKVGVTLREKGKDTYKISLRTSEDADASLICSAFGGGGHKRAAGCTICAPLEKAKQMLLEEIEKHLK